MYNDLFQQKPRSIDELTASALSVIDSGFLAGATEMLPLLSGGHDSFSACHIASQHPRFDGICYHIDTGIGAESTKEFVRTICKDNGWELQVFKSNFSYEKFVRRLGFPGPGAHQWVYNKLKDRAISMMTKGRKCKCLLLTGCRSQESKRRMGHVAPVKVGETSKKTGKVSRKNRIWTAPCHDWSVAEQNSYMEFHDLPRNPLKEKLGMSGECLCGAFAMPGELDRIRQYAPDVAAEIDRLSVIARECGTHDVWGVAKKKMKSPILSETGPLCSSCDKRAYFAGFQFEQPPQAAEGDA